MSTPRIPAVFNCQQCGIECIRKSHRGQKPKWCSQRCADLGKKGSERTCQRCGKRYFGLGAQYCSRECSGVALPTATTAVTEAHFQRDWPSVLELIQSLSQVNDRGCWIWTLGLDRHGYPRIKGRRSSALVHRLVLEAKFQAPLGSQSAHHTCAISSCVNPEHLQPVTHAANIAEMLGRRAYQERVRELEIALAALAPDHPLLRTIPVA